MLIEINGYWINPRNIAAIYNVQRRKTQNGYLKDCNIEFIGAHPEVGGLYIYDKTADEVAQEINSAIKRKSI